MKIWTILATWTALGAGISPALGVWLKQRARLLGGTLALAALAPLTASAQSACPANTTVSILTPTFTCTMADKTFSDFALANVPASAHIQFGQLGPLFAVTLNRDGVFFPMGTTIFDYKVSATAPMTILEGTVGVDVSFPPEVTVTSMNGQTVSIANGGTGTIFFNPGVETVTVDNTSHILTGTTELNSVSNDFTQVLIGIPEPGTLPLAALSLAGLAVVWWRRRGD